MRTIYTWTFPYFDVALSENGMTKVVKNIHWRFRADAEEQFVELFGSTGLDSPTEDSFVAFEDLTEHWAIELVSQKVDVDGLKAALEKELAEKITPSVVQLVPSFVSDSVS